MQFHLIFDSITIARALAFCFLSFEHFFLCFQKRRKKNDSIESESVSATWSWIVPLKQNICWLLIIQKSTSKCTHTVHTAALLKNEVKVESQSSKWKLMQSTCQCCIKYEKQFIFKDPHWPLSTVLYRTALLILMHVTQFFSLFCIFFLFSPERPVSIEK